ncbi:hypothetical protein B0H16DRAFT_1830031 [Mycena metata]|uniref:Zn(2)-C6 fungal-type domain-containing protein n=1 Tax=Mycena metata TaxID=1033252 RepID=A0AAD7KBL8_9AGAR|nr:hypothetical protein B0H16DRAFT_1830031 [Mycena metata]
MTSLTFQILSDQEIVNMKRTRGIMACAECQRRKLKCDKKFPCGSCVRRGRGDICPTGDMGPIGRGRRLMSRLTATIDHAGDRTDELTTAVATNAANPLQVLQDDLPYIKNISEYTCPSTPVQLKNTSTVTNRNALRTESNLGPTAGPSVYLSGAACGDRGEYTPPSAGVVDCFPFDADSPYLPRDTDSCMENLLRQLPEELRAWTLYDIFSTDASWYITPVRPNELHELIVFIYGPESNMHELLPHTLAVVFFAFAAAALMDRSLPPYNSESTIYFDLGRSALTLYPVFGSKDLHTIQALMLASIYYTNSGPRFNSDRSWTASALAVGLCQTLRLHVEEEHLSFEKKNAERRRGSITTLHPTLFWEVRSMETDNVNSAVFAIHESFLMTVLVPTQALSFVRPLTISAADITCEFPADTEQTMDSRGQTVSGYSHTKWKFVKEIVAAMAQAYTSATPPSYEGVMDLDRRLRQFIKSAPFTHYARMANQKGTFLAYVQAYTIPRLAGSLMLYMHRDCFIQALKDRPLDPLDSTYAASFLAAYRGASMLIRSDARSFALYPEHFRRGWPMRKSLVNAAFIAGSIVSRCPTSEIAHGAFADLLTAVKLVEEDSFLAEGNLVALHRLRNRAAAAYTAFRPLDLNAPGYCPSPDYNLSDDGNFYPAAGSRAEPDWHLRPSQPQPDAGVVLPSLLPDIMPPSTQNSWFPDKWAVTFPFEPLLNAPTASLAEGGDSLEGYLAAGMQSASTSAFTPLNLRETDWTIFAHNPR